MTDDGRFPGRLRDRLLIAVFMVALTAPAVAMVLGSQPGNYLNRTLAAFPAPVAADVLDAGYFVDLDTFVNDNFPLRPDAIEMKAAFQYRLLGRSANSSVIPGLGGWLFLDDEVEPTCTRTASEVIAELDGLAAAFASVGREFRFVVAPDKRSIYPEYLPEDMRGVETCTDEARAEIRRWMAAKPQSTVDLWEPVLEEKARRADTPIYWPHDTHWNGTAAIAAARAIVNRVAEGAWATKDAIDMEAPTEYLGDLMRMMGLRVSQRVPIATVRRVGQRIESAAPEGLGPPGQELLRFLSQGPGSVVGGKTLIIGDSYFMSQAGVFAPWFEDVSMVYLGQMGCTEMIEYVEDADTIILERVERAALNTEYRDYLAPLIARLDGSADADPSAAGADCYPEPAVALADEGPPFIASGPLVTDGIGCAADVVNGEPWGADGRASSALGTITIYGWAADIAASAAPRATFARLTDQAGRTRYAPTTPYDRPDVAAYYAAPALGKAGYEATFSTRGVPPGDYELDVVIDADRGPLLCDTGRTLNLREP